MQLEGKIDQFKGQIKATWGKLTDNDLERAGGNVERLVGIIKERTGETRQRIEEQLQKITK